MLVIVSSRPVVVVVVVVGGSVVSKAQYYYYITTGLYLCVLYRSPHNCNFKFSPSRSGKIININIW